MRKNLPATLRVTVFGGSSPKPGEPAYQHAYRLGYLLGQASNTVLTGGYMGTMEAVSRGTVDGGGKVIGVTCDEIEAWRPAKPNQWIQQELRCATLKQRLDTLIEACDAALALPGGIGTLTEIAVMWSQMQISPSPARPLILIGEGWQSTLEVFFDRLGGYVPKKYRNLVLFTTDVEQAFTRLQSLIRGSAS